MYYSNLQPSEKEYAPGTQYLYAAPVPMVGNVEPLKLVGHAPARTPCAIPADGVQLSAPQDELGLTTPVKHLTVLPHSYP